MSHIDLTVSRVIPANPDEVFDVWLDPKSPGSPWFGVARLILHPEVDGLFFHAVGHEGRTWPHYGRFVSIERPHRIEHTWVSEATAGIESIVTLTFEEQGADTLLTLHHANLPDSDMGRQHREGWTFTLDAIEKRAARRRAE